MPHGYWRRNLRSLKRQSRSKRHRRFSASVDFLRSWRAKSRAAVVRDRCLPYCGNFPRCPLTLTLSPDGGEGISCVLSLLFISKPDEETILSKAGSVKKTIPISHHRLNEA